jgi:Pentapeptide repeats (8 copies)
MEPKDLAKLQNDARTILVQALGGAVLLVGLYFTLRNLQLTQDRQITEHYTRAVEQLGSDKLEVRLGAIYALERIARDSERDHWPIMEILTAYVRERVPWYSDPVDHPVLQEAFGEQVISRDELRNEQPLLLPAADIQAVLTVVGRRTRTYGKEEAQRLDLAYTDLHEADLRGANLMGAYLCGVNLGAARLDGADFRDAEFYNANLQFAACAGTKLQGANLRGVNLRAAFHLTAEQLSTVKTLYEARLDPFLLQQIQQQCPHLLEEPQK